MFLVAPDIELKVINFYLISCCEPDQMSVFGLAGIKLKVINFYSINRYVEPDQMSVFGRADGTLGSDRRASLA